MRHMNNSKTLDLKLLSEIKTPSQLRVVGFSGDHLIIERLKEMGLHKGLELEYIGRAPLKGPMIYRFGNTVLALRAKEAACIQIQTA